jgi:hypothetical protein
MAIEWCSTRVLWEWYIKIRTWCILSLDFNQGVWVLMPELAVSFISVSVKDSSVCCWGTPNRLFICFSSKHCSFVYSTIRSNLILTCCSPFSPTVGMAMSKRIYIYTWLEGRKTATENAVNQKGSWGTRSDEDLHSRQLDVSSQHDCHCAQPLFGRQTWIWSKRTMAIYNLTPGQSFEKSEHVPAVQPINDVPTLSPCYKYPPPI